MMKADLFTDRLIHLMRDVFTGETLDPERRTRIYARITFNPRVKGMELWANPATPFDELSVEQTTGEADQLWLFPGLDTPAPLVKSAAFPLLND